MREQKFKKEKGKKEEWRCDWCEQKLKNKRKKKKNEKGKEEEWRCDGWEQRARLKGCSAQVEKIEGQQFNDLINDYDNIIDWKYNIGNNLMIS